MLLNIYNVAIKIQLRGKRGGERLEEANGGKMVMEGDLTRGGEHTLYRGCVVELYPETYIILLTSATQINSIVEKMELLCIHLFLKIFYYYV